MQLNPQETFTIARGLEDHRDNTVYYVRATVRNALTDALLATVNLENQGDNHRYSEQYQVPADVSGGGFWILVTTSVYTDSAYSTKATNYGDKYDTYLVMQRYNPILGPVGGGSDVDYKRIQKMIDKAVASLPAPVQAEPPKETDLSRVYALLDEAIGACQAIRIPEIPQPKETDLSPIISKIEETAVGLREEDLDGIREVCDSASAAMEERREGLETTAKRMETILGKVQDFFTDDMEKVLAGIEEVKTLFSGVEYVLTKPDKPREDDI